MSIATSTRLIDAPLPFVFQTVADINNYSQAVPHITKIEFLSETKSGVGAKFRETRLMGKREAATELEVTEYEQNERIRLIADAGGTIWDSVFTVAEKEGKTELHLKMEAKPYKLAARVFNMFIAGMVKKGLEADMDAVKAYCEKQEPRNV